MVDVKEAVRIAREYARDLLGASNPSLEEIERDTEKGRDVWRITLGFPSDAYVLERTIKGLTRDYKTFLIDVETGDVLAMRLRVIAA